MLLLTFPHCYAHFQLLNLFKRENSSFPICIILLLLALLCPIFPQDQPRLRRDRQTTLSVAKSCHHTETLSTTGGNQITLNASKSLS